MMLARGLVLRGCTIGHHQLIGALLTCDPAHERALAGIVRSNAPQPKHAGSLCLARGAKGQPALFPERPACVH